MDLELIKKQLELKKFERKWKNRYGVLGVTLTNDLYKEFKDYCNSTGYSMSGVIKVLIRNYLNEIKEKKNNE
jgi:metal-responsive CopG/Arc/MetJ family transcriptional regulator